MFNQKYDKMEEKLKWLLETHYNLFHADMIFNAIFDDGVSCADFIRGCVDIHLSERDTDYDEFTPEVFKRV